MEYNARLYDYPEGCHVTFYSKTITRNDKDNKSYIQKHREYLRKKHTGEDRTEEQEEHCRETSLGRTKNKIYNIARSNTWEWFITLTFDREKTDASDYDLVTHRLHNFLTHLQQRKCPALKYLVVPELHADKEHYHFHGLLADCDGLQFRYSGHDDADSGDPVYNIVNWTYGFTTATRVRDSVRASSYITKYITKENDTLLKEKNRYYCSRNIKRTEAAYLIEDQEDFLKAYSDRITYAKTVAVEAAHQRINYYELDD